ncbi:MAG: plasmid pRiA4b ORF-3 family protein [Candidatus Rokubacteria bacterium]|nr:plasmid pRiA4b ORF-3 family protein [Candidatus Rokubacteria bacterium]
MTGRSRAPRRPVVKHQSEPAYRLKITLLEVEASVWRRILVPGTISLDRLHMVIQKAMGWENAHLHEFTVEGRRFGEPDLDEPDENVEPEWKVTLREVAPEAGRRFEYFYDFGDSWMHEVVVERTEVPEEELRYPMCLAGERSCPPEDCGGPPGYADFLEAVRDPRHPEHNEILAWVGGAFDPEAFDLTAVNLKLRLLK